MRVVWVGVVWSEVVEPRVVADQRSTAPIPRDHGQLGWWVQGGRMVSARYFGHRAACRSERCRPRPVVEPGVHAGGKDGPAGKGRLPPDSAKAAKRDLPRPSPKWSAPARSALAPPHWGLSPRHRWDSLWTACGLGWGSGMRAFGKPTMRHRRTCLQPEMVFVMFGITGPHRCAGPAACSCG